MSILKQICTDNGIKTAQYRYLEKAIPKVSETMPCGFAAILENSKIIGYDETMETWEKRLTIAHELAHHLFGHLSGSVSKEQQEHEAQTFSTCFIALMLFQEYSQNNKKVYTESSKQVQF